MIERPLVSFLVLDFKKEAQTRLCLESIRNHVKVPYKLIYLDNGSNEDYPFQIYKDGLCDVLISKKIGQGGGYGQTDLIRYCDTPYFVFVQNDQRLIQDFDDDALTYFKGLVDNGGYKCVNLNGAQAGEYWTDRAHFMRTDFFNSLGPFPNGGPGLDDEPWNEGYLVDLFKNNKYPIAFIKPLFFADDGKWSMRECGDGLFKHRCDTKQLWVLKIPSKKAQHYPPLTDEEWDKVLKGQWKDGDIPEKWKPHSFIYWRD